MNAASVSPSADLPTFQRFLDLRAEAVGDSQLEGDFLMDVIFELLSAGTLTDADLLAAAERIS